MTVKDLINILEEYPSDMLVITRMMSCYEDLKNPEVVELFEHNSGESLYEQFYPSQWGKEEPVVFKALYFRGN